MKKLIPFLFIWIFVLSCSKDDDKVIPTPAPLATTPSAKAAYDNKNYGIYKGVFVGSSGTVTINLKNDSAAINAVLKIDGIATVYTSTQAITEGASTSITFSNGSNSFIFSVEGDGQNADVNTVNIAGHPNAIINVLKETSEALVECFEGTYSGNDHGVFNIAVINWSTTYADIQGLAYSTDTEDSLWVSGSIENNTISGEFSGGSYTGTRSANNLGGNWSNTVGESGTWSGTRTL